MGNIVDKFIKLRKEIGLTQATIAQFLELDQSYISKFENGEREIPLHVLQKVSNLAGVDLKYFFEDNNEKLNFISFRSDNLSIDDLKDIAKVNQVAINLKWMLEMVKEYE